MSDERNDSKTTPVKTRFTKERAAQLTYFLLRIISGFLFSQAGALILFGWFGGPPGGQRFPLLSQTGIGGLLEFGGGIAVMLGLFTRPVAFILSGEMAVAYWQFHAPGGHWPIQNQGMPAVLFSFIFLYIAAQGAGNWSFDALIARAKQGTDNRESDSTGKVIAIP